MSARPDPLWRRVGAMGFRALVNLQTLRLARPTDKSAPRLWYGGAKPGRAGGPALKVAKLQAVFPETEARFNLAYLLSAAPYLSASSFGRLQKAGIASVLNQNGVFYPAWFAGDWQARNLRMAIAHAQADHILYQSDFCRRAAQRFLGPRDHGWEILYNAVDTAAFSPTEEEFRSPFLFLVTGKIDAHQAHRATQALEGLALARQQGLSAGLILAGLLEDEVKRQIEATISRHRLEDVVLLPGPYGQAEAPLLYRSAQAYVTLTHQDACPTGVIEAMASGLPVIHPTSGGVPELVGESGVAIETGEDWDKTLIPSSGAVAEAMLSVAQKHEFLSRLARRRAVENFSFERWIDRHRRLFQDLLERT